MTSAAEPLGPDLPPGRRMEAVVFDLDGLMVDTETLSGQAWDRALSGYGLGLDEKIRQRINGLNSLESSALIIRTLGLSLDPETLLEAKSRIFGEMVRSGVPAMPGLRTLLGRLEDRSLPWAVATSSGRDYAEAILTDLGVWAKCAALAAGDEVERPKPSPEVYLLAASRLGFAPSDCLAVEDSIIGCASARSAGMTVAAVPGRVFDLVRFHDADFVFESLTQLALSLDSVGGGYQTAQSEGGLFPGGSKTLTATTPSTSPLLKSKPSNSG